jgi:hypothetical protein
MAAGAVPVAITLSAALWLAPALAFAARQPDDDGDASLGCGEARPAHPTLARELKPS